MNDFKKAENIVQLMKELRYIPNNTEVLKIELNEDNNINIVFIDYENIIVPREVWEMDSYEIYKSWINLMIEAEKEQNKITFYDTLPDIHKKYFDRLENEIKEDSQYPNCSNDKIWFMAQLELIKRIKNHEL